MEEIIESLPDRPITREEFREIAQHDSVVDAECLMGVVVTDEQGGSQIDAYLDPFGQTAFDYYMDLIIETESSIGIAAYPKEPFPSPSETSDKPIIEIISASSGDWTWISKGPKSDYSIEDGLWDLEEYRDLGPEGRESFETIISIPTLRILQRNETGLIRPFINVFKMWLSDKFRR